jgi:hypothetical protein
MLDRLCGLVVGVPGYRSRGRVRFPALVGLERGPPSLVSTIEELLESKSSGSGLENSDYVRGGFSALNTRHLSIRKS